MSEETQKAADAARRARFEAEGKLDELVGDHPRDLEALDAEAAQALAAIEKKKLELADAKEWLNDVGQRSRALRTVRTPEAIAKAKAALERAKSEEKRLAEIHAFDEAGPPPVEVEPPPPPLPRPPTLEEWKAKRNAPRGEPRAARDSLSPAASSELELEQLPPPPALVPFALEGVEAGGHRKALMRRPAFVAERFVITEGAEYFDVLSLKLDEAELIDEKRRGVDFIAGADGSKLLELEQLPKTDIEIEVRNNDSITRDLRGYFLVRSAPRAALEQQPAQATTV